MVRVLLVLLAAGCGTVIPRDEEPPRTPPAFKVVSFQELGLVPQQSVVQGQDSARSALRWGKSVWTFGTTVLNKAAADGISWHTNSFAITDDVVGNDGLARFSEKLDIAGTPARLLTPTADEAMFNASHAGNPCQITPCGAYYDVRPLDSVWDAARSRVVMLYSLGYLQPGSEQRLGDSVAIWSSIDTAPARPTVSGGEHPTVMFTDKEPSFGAAMQIVDDDLYVFACDPDAARFSSPCKLARVPLDAVLERSAWQFWDGTRFSSKLEDAAEVFTGNWIMSVVHSPLIDQWIAIYAEPLTNVIMARNAPALTGPWSEQIEIFKTPAPAADRWTSDAALHDEYTENGGRTLYLSYSRPSPTRGGFGSEVVWYRVDVAALP